MEPKARPAAWATQRAALNPQQANPDPARAGDRLDSFPPGNNDASDFMVEVMEDQLALILETVEPEDRF